MQKRDTFVLITAILCGLLAFILILRLTKKPAHDYARVASSKGQSSSPLPIPAGMRALTLSEKNIENFPDLLEAGNYVDVLGLAPNYEGQLDLQTIVRGAQVLIFDKKEGLETKSMTLALTPTGAEVVSKATAHGKIRLILRPDGGEKNVIPLTGAGLTEVIRGVDKDKNIHL